MRPAGQARTHTDRQMDGEMTIIILLRRHLILSLLPPHRTRADGILPTGPGDSFAHCKLDIWFTVLPNKNHNPLTTMCSNNFIIREPT